MIPRTASLRRCRGLCQRLDVLEEIRSRLGPGSVLPAVHPLAFKHPKENFGRRIVGKAAYRTHAARDVMPGQEVQVLGRRTLTAAIGMENDRRPSAH